MFRYEGKPNKLVRSLSGQLTESTGYLKSFPMKSSYQYQKSFLPMRKSQKELKPKGSIRNSVNDQNDYQLKPNQNKKQQMVRRIKQIQCKVMPLIESNEKNITMDEITTNSRLQQKITKLETTVDAIQKQMDIKMEKKILQMQKVFLERINDLQQRLTK